MNKYKKLALNTIIFSIGSFSSKLLSFLLVRFYTEYLTKTETSTFDLFRCGNDSRVTYFIIGISHIKIFHVCTAFLV